MLKKIIHAFRLRLSDRYYLELLQKKGLVVGENFQMLHDVIIDQSHCWHITIGNNVTLAPGVHLIAHDASTKLSLGYTKIGRVTIGDNVFIGAGSIVLPGVQIGNNVIVGAGSVVTMDIGDNVVVAGNPAKKLETMDAFLRRRRDELALYPCFGHEYTVEGGLNDRKKAEMIAQMVQRYGYIR